WSNSFRRAGSAVPRGMDLLNHLSSQPASEKNEIGEEHERKRTGEPAHASEFPAEQLNQWITDEAQRQSIGNRVGERNPDNGQKCRHGFGEISPIDLADVLRHERADDHQRGSSYR